MAALLTEAPSPLLWSHLGEGNKMEALKWKRRGCFDTVTQISAVTILPMALLAILGKKVIPDTQFDTTDNFFCILCVEVRDFKTCLFFSQLQHEISFFKSYM